MNGLVGGDERDRLDLFLLASGLGFIGGHLSLERFRFGEFALQNLGGGYLGLGLRLFRLGRRVGIGLFPVIFHVHSLSSVSSGGAISSATINSSSSRSGSIACGGVETCGSA